MTAYMGPERRVLDKTQRAEPRRMNQSWIVTAGTGVMLCVDQDEAWKVALVHNAANGFIDVRTDRRES